MRGSSQQSLQPAFDRFSAAYNQAITKISSKKIEVLCLSRRPSSVVCKWAAIHCSRWRRSSTLRWYSLVTEVGTKELIHGLVKQTQFCVSYVALWWQNWSFQRLQSLQFSNRSLFRSSPVVMNLRWRLKEYCQKSKWQRWDICEEFSVWQFVTRSTGLKFVKPGMSSHFSELRDPRYVSSAMYPECPRKDWPTKSFGLQSTPSGKQPRAHPRTRWRDYISDLAWSGLGAEASRTIWNSVDREVFRVLLGLLPPRLSSKVRLAWIWVNEWVCRPKFKLPISEIVFSLFAKSECRIQIIKHIWTKTCFFVKIS